MRTSRRCLRQGAPVAALVTAACLGLLGAMLPAARAAAQPTGTEWHQFAHDAQRTGYTDQVVPVPWRWKWAWNGPNETGQVRRGKFGLPRNSQPVTGGGRVYVAGGRKGVYALDAATGALVWRRRTVGHALSTPAYDPATQSLFVYTARGNLYKLDAATGAILGRLKFGNRIRSSVPLPPALVGNRVVVGVQNLLVAVDTATLQLAWQYDAGAAIHTPAAYSPSRARFLVVTQDLFVHAVDAATGTRAWRVKPTVRSGGDPGGTDTALAEAAFGWPVVAEQHGYVLVKYRLDWQALWTWSPWPGTNTAMRANLAAAPEHQALFVLDLDDGSAPFSTNVGHGGFGDGDYLPMGALPVVKSWPGDGEVAYVVMRGAPCLVAACDGRADSHLGELLLDDATVPGYAAGDVRFMANTFFPTDEQVYLSMAGDVLLGGHWAFGLAHQITDRSPARGAGATPITTADLPHVTVADDHAPFVSTHYFGDFLCAEGCGRSFPAGFFIYHTSTPVYDRYWSEYASWVVSGDTVYFVSTDGAVVAVEHDPGAGGAAAGAVAGAETTGQASRHASVTEPQSLMCTADDAAVPTVAVSDLGRFTGRVVVVEATVRRVFNNGKAVYLTFTEPHQRTFVIRILRSAWAHFPRPPEALYRAGMRIRAVGTVDWYQGGPAFHPTRPEQIVEVAGRG